ncbi:hypothetical protein BST11_09455 [Mycobacterium alsense]|uniref:Uncharacterized protein n=1 Tax=Mycobacterium alsense TaxID=324058 RepID=A0AA41XR66_9MYCO|nr:hypothetical protein [Mycobacterium alsense]OQZ91310.1 hypothetical protein BST11_09455 [Mycobacterium alsense]
MVFAGCGSRAVQYPAAPPPKIPWTGNLSEDRVVWSAEPGIDLLTGAAAVVRAYVESVVVAETGGDIGYAYPGFTRAVPPDAPEGQPDSARDRWPNTEHPIRDRVVGTGRYHILRIDTSGRQVTAVVCGWGYGEATDLGNGTYGSKGAAPATDPTAGLALRWVRMTAPEHSASPPLPNQKGPAAAPVDDVFGGWQVVGYLTADPAMTTNLNPAEWPSASADAQSCVDKAPDPLERRLHLLNGAHPRSDFPTLPPYPGWPAAGAQ